MITTRAYMPKAKSTRWETPADLFAELDEEFRFELDPCAATPETAKTPAFFTPSDDGLSQPWGRKRVFVNPPYGRALPGWLSKAWEEAQYNGATVVMLLPTRTDTKWFHEYVMPHASEVRFIEGRVKYRNPDTGLEAPAPFPSMIVVFYPAMVTEHLFSSWRPRHVKRQQRKGAR